MRDNWGCRRQIARWCGSLSGRALTCVPALWSPFQQKGCAQEVDKNSKRVLSGDQDLSCVLSAASQVKQTEQHAGRTDAQELVEVARHALAVVHSGDFRAAQKWHIGMPRIGGPQCDCTAPEQGAYQ